MTDIDFNDLKSREKAFFEELYRVRASVAGFVCRAAKKEATPENAETLSKAAGAYADLMRGR